MTLLGAGTAKQISADGAIIGGDRPSGAVLWELGGTTALGPGAMYGMSRDGRAATGTDFWWTSTTGYQTLPGNQPSANGISGDGSTVVGGVQAFPYSIATRWTASGPSSLGQIPGGTPDSIATVASHDGSIIFGMARGPSGYDTFRWTQETGMVGLDVAGPGFSAPLPRACTPDGGIIVGNAFTEAFVWTLGSGPESVQYLLEEVYGLDLGGMHLSHVNGISDDGRTLVGYGDVAGSNRGWFATLPWSIPSPSAASALALAGLIAAGRRRISR